MVKAAKETVMILVVVTIINKVEVIRNSSIVHNTTGNIYGENVPRTERATQTNKYMVEVKDVDTVVLLNK